METVKTVQIKQKVEKIGVIADTHIPARAGFLPATVYKYFEDVDLILHAGDLVDESVLKDLEAIAPVEAVAGNMDSHVLRDRLRRYKCIEIGEYSIALLHGDTVMEGYRRAIVPRLVINMYKTKNLDAVVFGHLHIPMASVHASTLFFNPGSPVDPRYNSGPSLGMLTIENGTIKERIIEL